LLGAVDLLQVGDSHFLETLPVRGLGEDEPALDLAVQAPHGGGREHAFGRSSRTHHGVNARAHYGGRDAGREVAVADEADAATRPCPPSPRCRAWAPGLARLPRSRWCRRCRRSPSPCASIRPPPGPSTSGRPGPWCGRPRWPPSPPPSRTPGTGRRGALPLSS